MNLIKAALSYLDTLWSFLTIPCLLIFGIYVIQFFPIPTLLVMLLWIYFKFCNATWLMNMASVCEDKKLKINSRNERIGAYFVIIATVLSFGFWTYLNLINNNFCREQNAIPFNLASILMKIFPNKC